MIVLVLMLPFEIRDLQYDSLEHRTIPQRFGVPKTKLIGVIWTVIIFLMTFLKDEFCYFDLFIKTIICLALVVAIVLSHKKSLQILCDFLGRGPAHSLVGNRFFNREVFLE